jgi:hypothetical protein
MTNGIIPATRQPVNSRGPVDTQFIGAAATVLYVNKVGDDGWLQAKDDAASVLVPLCKYTKVASITSKHGRTSFKVQDGSAMGKVLSLSDANAKIYLGSKAPQASGITATVTYGKYVEGWVSTARGGEKLDQQLATLRLDGSTYNVTMNSVWNSSYSPIPAGQYTIMLPDTPHNSGYTRFYRKAAPDLRFDQVWFPIKYGDNSRYVHVGNLSEGCTTVLDLDKWNAVHEALISHRQDSKNVGTLIVKGTPGRGG